LRSNEDRLSTGEEHECVDSVGELEELELGARLVGVSAWLPHFEAMERREDDVAGRRHVVRRVGRVTPVPEGLLSMGGQAPSLARTLHLDQAPSWPEQVEEPPLLRLLEPSPSIEPIGAVAAEQLIEECLGLRPLAALVETPLARKVDEVALDLLARHRGSKSIRWRA